MHAVYSSCDSLVDAVLPWGETAHVISATKVFLTSSVTEEKSEKWVPAVAKSLGWTSTSC